MNKGRWLALPALGWLIGFFFVPLLFVVVISLCSRGNYGEILYQFTLENYRRFFEPLYINILWDTIEMAAVTTALTFLLGYPLAYRIVRMNRSWQNVWLLMVMVPFWINFLIRSYAWVVILRSQGLLNTFLITAGFIDQPLNLLYNPAAVQLGMVYTHLPFMVLPVYVSLEQLDRRLLEASYDLGGTPWQTFRHVTLPLTLPGIVAGSILVFVSSLGMFVVPDIMGGAKSALIGNLIQNQFLSARDWPFGSALSILLTLFSLVLIFLYYRVVEAQKGKGGRQ
ncbi:spermidine/putrescine abc transporter, permease protein [Heliomicrobium modesticaldum Ice1]|uniref:Spermidine/putrescine abc transporter, permease protein n=1 Tax=Heliobacterium modesticaldum (strain ATCC 51547 / Ice1) TaxID=498761 RepID=B0THQ0_HELMI|nr:ABC transporter permease [Heliomicrobium modesticaldum]ABZ84833.1 spermidine/putrescine abc transporter, permease protein [Heliomicrobium modesticaldum Ice1]